MAVNIDSVYQKVLALANKEQRGYITPQEFNLFADHAQKEIFEQYFYDLSQLLRSHGNSEEYSDIINNIRDKINIFEEHKIANNPAWMASDVYRLGSVFVENTIPWGLTKDRGVEAQRVQQDELRNMQRSPLLKPRSSRPVYVIEKQGPNRYIYVHPIADTAYTKKVDQIKYTYIGRPSTPVWGYAVINGDAMYDVGNSIHFQLHESEEAELVYRVLTQAGVAIQRQDVTQAAVSGQVLQNQQEKI